MCALERSTALEHTLTAQHKRSVRGDDRAARDVRLSGRPLRSTYRPRTTPSTSERTTVQREMSVRAVDRSEAHVSCEPPCYISEYEPSRLHPSGSGGVLLSPMRSHRCISEYLLCPIFSATMTYGTSRLKP